MTQINADKTIREIGVIRGQPAAAKPKVSVIVPVYKVEKYLAECIESVLSQTFTDFELILVDDGSPDNSGKICDDYAKKDSRIRVFHKPNGGVTSARRLGVEQAKGEWIMFVDSDDKVFPHTLSVLLENATPDIDLVEGAISRLDVCATVPAKNFFSKKADAAAYATGLGCQTWYSGPFAKIFRKGVLQGNTMHVSRDFPIGEDTLMNLRAARFMREAIQIGVPLYFYRNTPGSALKTNTLNENYWLRFLEEIRKCLDEIAFPSVQERSRAFAWHALRVLKMMILKHVGFSRETWLREIRPIAQFSVEINSPFAVFWCVRFRAEFALRLVHATVQKMKNFQKK